MVVGVFFLLVQDNVKKVKHIFIQGTHKKVSPLRVNKVSNKDYSVLIIAWEPENPRYFKRHSFGWDFFDSSPILVYVKHVEPLLEQVDFISLSQ